MKGAVYNERFTSIKSLEAELDRMETRVREYQRERIANRFPRLRELNERLERLCATKARENNGRFERSNERDQEREKGITTNNNDRSQVRYELAKTNLQERAKSAHIQSPEPNARVYEQETSLDYNSSRSRIFGGGLYPLQVNIIRNSDERERILRELSRI